MTQEAAAGPALAEEVREDEELVALLDVELDVPVVELVDVLDVVDSLPEAVVSSPESDPHPTRARTARPAAARVR